MLFKSVKDFSSGLKKSAALPNIIIAQSSVHESIQLVYNSLLDKMQALHSQVDTVSLNGLETDPATFHSEMATIPMFDAGRIILVRHADAVLKKIDANKTILSYFIRDFKNMYEKTLLILQCETKLPASLQEFSEKAWLIEEEKPRAKDIPEIIKTRVHTMGFEIDDAAIREMMNRYSLNPSVLTAALDRLFLYCMDEKKISKDDVHEVAINVEGELVFEIIDCLAARDTDKAVKLFQYNEFSNGVFFGGSINKFFTDLTRYSALKKCGLGLKEIHERLELNTRHNFIYRKNEERFSLAMKNYREEEYPGILEKLFELDRAMKENNAAEIQKNILTIFMISLGETR